METTLPISSGPRERLAMYGRAALSDSDLIAVLLGTGSITTPVAVLAAQVLELSGGLHGLVDLSISELAQQPGIGSTKASRLLAAMELGARVQARPLTRVAAISSSRDVDAALRPRLRSETREHFIAIVVDAKNRPVAELDIAIGGLSACCVTPADIFRRVVRHPAAGVLFAHNHPSGEASPSDEDILVTHRLMKAGLLLGVQVLDHLVVGRDSYFSFLDAGLLTLPPPPSLAPG
jgi:DNA repair protein RadC